MLTTPFDQLTSAQMHTRRNAFHIWHVWINRRQENRAAGADVERDLYEWKNAVEEVARLPHWLKRAREGALPTTHQQCSHQEPEPIVTNRLVCVLGQDVTTCPILQSLYATFAEEAAHEDTRGERYYADCTPEVADEVAAQTCAWHIFTEHQKRPSIDTSEGYVQDESDRRFWSNVYANLSATDDEEEPPELAEDVVMRALGAAEFPGLADAD